MPHAHADSREKPLALSLAYGAGLRAAEVCSLKVSHADRQRMVLRIEQGKAEVLTTIAADPRHLGAKIGATLVLHTWGSALTHHPHVHGIVPGGKAAPDGKTWLACRPGSFLPVRVLSRLFRRRFVEDLQRARDQGRLECFDDLAALADAKAFAECLAPLRKCEWSSTPSGRSPTVWAVIRGPHCGGLLTCSA